MVNHNSIMVVFMRK